MPNDPRSSTAALAPTAMPVADPPDPDRTLLDHVRPNDWVEPSPAQRYDLVVVGAGTAGLVAAAGGAGLGLRVGSSSPTRRTPRHGSSSRTPSSSVANGTTR